MKQGFNISSSLAQLSKSRRGLSLIVCCTFITVLIFGSSNYYRRPYEPDPRAYEWFHSHGALAEELTWAWDVERDRRSFILNQTQCTSAFPSLYTELDRVVADRDGKKITLKEIDSIPMRNGMTRVMIHNQQVHVIAKDGMIYSRDVAFLLALNRAVTSSPEPLPNVEFIVSVDDGLAPTAKHVAEWSLARKADNKMAWLMPDYTFWAWPETKAGSYGEVQDKAVEMEQSSSNPTGQAWRWEDKIPKAMWRGATMNVELRKKLLQVTKDKSWADVKELDWHDKESTDADLKSLAEHCQYKFPVNTAGISYSGRLKYIQNCHSVILMHEDDWITSFTHLMKRSGPEQNFVELKTDFSDLEETMQALLANDGAAKSIADNSVKTFRDRYLTPAAEACYWRHMIRSWASVSDFEPKLYKTGPDGNLVWRGIPVESYVLERRLEWDPY